MAEYLPKIKEALNLVVEKVKKILNFLGEDVVEVNSLGESDIDTELKELEELLNKLRGL